MSTRKQCAGAGGLSAECLSRLVRRTIWDGTQELAEIQAPLDTFANPPLGTQELNTGVPLIPGATCAFDDPCDPNPFFGRVVYGPGLAVDQPLSVTRYENTDNVSGSSLTWPTFGLSVFWNYRGTPAYGVVTDGAAFRPHTPTPGQTACPSLASTATDRCVKLQWPLAQSAYDRSRGRTVPGSWQGTILANKVDGTGLEYARNRVYDSQSGRFTQEDPIGLAGGLNLYGFAGGDPANFSDPFGLCVGPAVPICWQLIRTAAVGAAAWIAAKVTSDAAAERVKIYVDPDDGDAASRHAGDAQQAGNPTSGTNDRVGARDRRRERLRGTPTVPGMDRDEYPPAVVKPDATGVSIRHIPQSDNRRSGASIGKQIRGLPDGTPVDIVVGKKPIP